MRRLLVWMAVLVVLGAGGYFGDSALRDETQRRVAATLTAELQATGVDARLGGWPFSLALLTRTVPSAVVTAETATVGTGERELELSDVAMTTGEIVLAGDDLQARQVSGTATLDYPGVEKLAGVPVRYAGDGRLGLSYKVTVLSRTITVEVSTKPVVDVRSATIQLTEPRAGLNGTQVDVPIDQRLIDSLVKPIDVSLDYGLRVTGITPDAEGLDIVLAADSATFPLR